MRSEFQSSLCLVPSGKCSGPSRLLFWNLLRDLHKALLVVLFLGLSGHVVSTALVTVNTLYCHYGLSGLAATWSRQVNE